MNRVRVSRARRAAKHEALEFGRYILRGVHVPARGEFCKREEIALNLRVQRRLIGKA